MGVIYSIINPKGKVYVGQTRNLYNRAKSHKSSPKSNNNFILLNSIRKYGWENHCLSVLEECSHELMNEREIFWIEKLNSFCGNNKQGLNMSLGGAVGNPQKWKHDKPRVEKARERFAGENNPFFGKKHPPEVQKILTEKARQRQIESGRTVPRWGAEKAWATQRKKIAAYNLRGDFLGAFNSTANADKELRIKGSRDVASGFAMHLHGFVFRYYDNNPLEKIDVSGIKFSFNNRPIIQLNKNKEIINTFANAKEAQEKTGIPHGNITRGARESRVLRSGHFFIYKDEEILNNINNN